MPSIYAHLLPALVSPDALSGGTAVVIDVLRATTVINYALAAGAERVLPCGEVDEARELARRLSAESAGPPPLLGGERGGLPIEGFDLGNSPRDYTPERVRGRTIVFTTTNGTRAMLHSRLAAQILIAAMVNRQAIADRLRGVEQVHILCAGTEGYITREDVLAAGAIIDRIINGGHAAADASTAYELNDEARLALDTWRAALPPVADASHATSHVVPLSPPWLIAALALSRGGQNLRRIGLARDLEESAAIDRFAIVPELDPQQFEIRLR